MLCPSVHQKLLVSEPGGASRTEGKVIKYEESRQEGDMAAPRPPRLRETTSSLKLESFTCLYSGESIHLV